MAARREALSERRQQILTFIYTYIQTHGRPPTVRDIQKGIGVASTAVVKYHLDLLERSGYVERAPKASRGLRLTAKARAWLNDVGQATDGADALVRVPIVGYIVAGEPVTM